MNVGVLVGDPSQPTYWSQKMTLVSQHQTLQDGIASQAVGRRSQQVRADIPLLQTHPIEEPALSLLQQFQ